MPEIARPSVHPSALRPCPRSPRPPRPEGGGGWVGKRTVRHAVTLARVGPPLRVDATRNAVPKQANPPVGACGPPGACAQESSGYAM